MGNESLVFKSGVNIGAFIAGIGAMEKGARAAAGKITSAFSSINGTIAGLGAAVGVGLSADAFASGVKGALDLGGAMSDMAAKTGIAIKALLPLQQVLADNGLAAEDLGGAITKMQVAITKGGGPLAAMGDGLSQIKSLTPDQQFIAIGKAINGISDPAQKAAAAVNIFGKAGANLLATFSDPAFGTAPATMTAQAELLERNADIFDKVSDKLARTGNVTRGFFLGFAEGVAPAMEKVLDKFEAINLVDSGRQFANFLTKAAADIAPMIKAIGDLYNKVNGGYNEAMGVADGIHDKLFGKDTAPGASINGVPQGGPANNNRASRALPSDFWSGADPRNGIFKGLDPRDAKSGFIGGTRGVDGRVADNARRFGDSLSDDSFRQRFEPTGSPESLERWGKRMGVKEGPYHQIHSRTQAERKAEKDAAGGDTVKLSGDSINQMKNGFKEAVKEIVSK